MSVNFDSTFGFDPAVQDSSMAARGLYATMVTWCDHQIYTRPDSFDGTFDLKRVRSVGGTVRLVRELVENGLFEEAGEGVYRVVTRVRQLQEPEETAYARRSRRTAREEGRRRPRRRQGVGRVPQGESRSKQEAKRSRREADCFNFNKANRKHYRT